jgi:hypothetical protein
MPTTNNVYPTVYPPPPPPPPPPPTTGRDVYPHVYPAAVPLVVKSTSTPQDVVAASCNCPTTATTTSSTTTSGLSDNEFMSKLRTQALSNTPPHIIECASATAGESQTACHLPPLKRFASLGQKGATLWMTGCSGSGKTTITTALEEKVVKEYGKHVYRLDGDNLRTGLNRDFRFSESDGAESVRRTGELATLFSDGGMITLVGLISPYRQDRDEVRKRRSETNTDFEHFPKTGGPRTHESACPFQFH